MEELVLNKLANKGQWIIESDDELTEYALEVKRQFLSRVVSETKHTCSDRRANRMR